MPGALQSGLAQTTPVKQISEDGKLRIIVLGAHPDDCEHSAGGTGAKWAAQGHRGRAVFCTNGDIGHWGMAGGPLARRRASEVQRCAEILGNSCQVLELHFTSPRWVDLAESLALGLARQRRENKLPAWHIHENSEPDQLSRPPLPQIETDRTGHRLWCRRLVVRAVLG